MKNIILLIGILGIAACSNNDKAPTPAAKPADKAAAPAAAPAAAVAGALSAQKMWDIGQNDDSAMRKQFTITGAITTIDGARLALNVTPEQRVDLWLADEGAAAKLAAGATVTATCTMEGSTPRTVTLRACALK